jgi:hypothetical protein
MLQQQMKKKKRQRVMLPRAPESSQAGVYDSESTASTHEVALDVFERPPAAIAAFRVFGVQMNPKSSNQLAGTDPFRLIRYDRTYVHVP